MGVYQVPLEIGMKISIDNAIKYSLDFEKIFLVCFKDKEFESYCEYLNYKKNNNL